MKIKIKKLNEEAVIPKYSKHGDAAMDVVAVSKNVTEKFIEYGTGLSFEVPENYVMLIFPRSSVSNKTLSQCNSVGVLDSGYRGELKIRFYKIGSEEYEIGERVAQIMVLPRPEVEFQEVAELSPTERGDGGFGHTGK
ncbi:MAG: dUTP diphosphatase [Nanoarchaeota archaeon]|nr:dUTP diphosphatase [Nanoarchaeota archaeon]